VAKYPESSAAFIDIDAPVERVFSLVGDLTRMGEWSPECFKFEWEGGSSEAAVGARFRGYNRFGENEWEEPGQITDFEFGRCIEFQVQQESEWPSTWRFDFEPAGDGTRLRESFIVPVINVEGSGANFEGRFEMLHGAIETTLAKIKAAVESSTDPSSAK
jgi:uncharacterized protein YndB with AHSA1/START domain